MALKLEPESNADLRPFKKDQFLVIANTAVIKPRRWNSNCWVGGHWSIGPRISIMKAPSTEAHL